MRLVFLATLFSFCVAASSSFAESWPPRNVAGVVEYAPKPGPQPGLHGSGVFVLRIHIPSGRVTDVAVALSTGSVWLDRSAVAALRRWRFKPDATPYHKALVKISPPQTRDETFVKVPIPFQ
jgi:TonB family protein